MSTKKLQIIGNLGGSSIKIDDTLTKPGLAADAKATGDALNQLQVNIDEVAGLVGGADVEYYTEEEIDSMVADLNAAIDSKSDVNHIHDNLYYTETEIDDKFDTMQLNIDSKVDAVDGMGLSTNDYTTAEKDKLETVEANANFYEHPTHASHSSGLYKITVDESGHVSGAVLAEMKDIVELGIPAQDTTYDEEISDLSDRIDSVENSINTTNKALEGVAQDFESYKTTNNEAVSTNASGIEANKTAIEAIQSDYLTSTNKEQLEDEISKVSEKATANATAIEVLNGEGDGSVKQSIDNAFNEFAANVTNDDVINTYKELIDYAAAHGSEFTELVGEVDTINIHLGEVEADLFDYKTVVSEQFTGVNDTIDSHFNNLDNPHIVTKEQIGLANVDDTSDLEKPISNATQAALDEKADYEHIHDDATTTTSGFMSADDKAQLLDLQIKVGDMAVSDQITEAIAEYINTSGNAVYVQNDEPLDAADGALWVDLDDEGAVENGGAYVVVDTTLTKPGQAADAKAVGDAISNIETSIGNLESNVNTKVPTTRTINGKALSSNVTLTPKDIGAADATETNNAISNLNTLVGDSSVSDQITEAIEEAIVEVFVQNDAPENAPEGSIWVDLDADGAPTTSGKTTANVYVVDARTTDVSTVDFSQYAIGDVVVVTVS